MDGVVDFGGSGRPIVLLHGLMGRATTWWSVAQWLTSYGHVVGLDARAHGFSPLRGAASTEEFADDVVDLILSLDSGPAVLVGHSMGGLHALVAAARRPELVRGVVMEDMAVDQRGRTVDVWRSYFDSWPSPFQSLAHVRQFFAPYGDYFCECMVPSADGYRLMADLEVLYDIASEWGRRDYWSYVDGLEAPLLVVEAATTPMPVGQQAVIASRVADGQHIVVPGSGHVVHDDRPAEFQQVVSDFLRRL